MLSLAGWAAGAEPGPAPGAAFAKPAWLTDFSVGLKESYDSDVYLSGVAPRYLPATYPVVPGGVTALKDRTSWVTTVSPKLGFNFVPLLPGSNLLQVLSLGYAPEFASYHNEPTENYNAHRISTAIKGQAQPFSFNLENGFNYVDGSKIAPIYPGALLSAFSTAAPRERREQWQDRAKITLQYDLGKVFVRPTASLLYYELLTLQTNVAGYQNYPDRFDVNGGADIGYRLSKDLAVLAGYRYGRQYQEQFRFDVYSSSSEYQRALIGIEGKPWKWLTVSLSGGPDFRSYDLDRPGHITPVGDKHLTTYYGEASLAAEISPADAVTFKYRQFQWVSSIGKVPYFDSLYDLGYRHKFGRQLALDLGGRIQAADYTSGNLASSHRDDWQFSVSAGLSYSFTANLSASLGYGLDLGRNAQDHIVNPQNREFDRHLVSLGATFKL